MNFSILPIIVLFSFPLIYVFGELENDVDFLVYKGIQYTKLGDYETAISIFDQVLKKDKNNIPALINLANTYSSLNKHFMAVKFYERVLEIDPNNSSALYGFQISLLETTSYKLGYLNGVLEIKVNDSKGGLIAYLQSSQIKTLNHPISENVIDSWPVSKIINRNNQDYSLHQKKFVQVLDKDTILGFHEIPFSDKMDIPMTSTWYYQIPVEKGDVISYTYSFFRPVK